uniref:Uncharacterized protein n=1 Tax=Cryptomonas curvata TaxID=233186 RepID=A0A7S0QCM1_9CRYP
MCAPLNHKLSPVLSPAVEAIENAIQDPFCGIYVHWGPFGSGKAVALQDLTLIMRSKGHVVKYLDAQDTDVLTIENPKFTDWLLSDPGLHFGRFKSFLPSSKIGPTVIIINRFDYFMMKPRAKAVIKAVLLSALENQNFKIVLGITRCDDALEILKWNGGEKIRIAASAGCGRWGIDDIIAIAAFENRLKRLKDEERAEIIRLGAVSGSPSVFHEMVFTGPNVDLALMSHQEYAEGIEKLNSI